MRRAPAQDIEQLTRATTTVHKLMRSGIYSFGTLLQNKPMFHVRNGHRWVLIGLWRGESQSSQSTNALDPRCNSVGAGFSAIRP